MVVFKAKTEHQKNIIMATYSMTIIEEIISHQFLLKCACCDGSGKMSKDHDGRDHYVPCTVCNGRGVVMVEFDGSLPFVKYALCNGSGEQSKDRDNRSPYIICTMCKGVGTQPVTGDMRMVR